MKRIIIIIGCAVVLVAAGLALYLFYFKGGAVNQNTANINLPANINFNANLDENLNVNSAVTLNTNQTTANDQEKLKEVSRIFAERYGSYSNKNDFENLIALKTYMTDKLQKETDTYIKAEKSKMMGNETYFGVTSETLSVNVSSLTEKKADSLVTLSRTERNETSPTASYFQNLSLKLIKSGDSWLVDSTSWQEKITQ